MKTSFACLTILVILLGSVPASAAVIGTNSSGQPVSAATTGSGNVVLASSPAISAPTVSGTLAGASKMSMSTRRLNGATYPMFPTIGSTTIAAGPFRRARNSAST